MKKVKELKVGDKVWYLAANMDPSSGYIVKSIKKQKTLAIVTIDYHLFGKHKDVICYGHVSGELLVFNGQGFERTTPLVCDYARVLELTDISERRQKLINRGTALNAIFREFKNFLNQT